MTRVAPPLLTVRPSRGARASIGLALALFASGCVTEKVITVTVGTVTVQPELTRMFVGETVPFTSTVRDENGRALPRATTSWVSDDPAIATVDADGMVTAVSAGNTRITATFRGVNGSGSVEVIPPPSFEPDPDSIALLAAIGIDPPASQLLVQNGGGGILDGVAATVLYQNGQPQGWLEITLSGTRAPVTITATASVGSLPAGTYDASISVTSPDVPSGPFLIPVTLSITGITVSETGGFTAVAEDGRTDSVTVVLDTQPDTTVTIAVSSSDQEEVSVAPPTLTFTPANWSTGQTVVLTGQDELLSDGDQIVPIVVAVDSASDVRYLPVPPDTVLATNVDDDFADFAVTESGGVTNVTEGGAVDSVTVVLLAEPLTPVVVNVTAVDPTEVTGAPATITFDPVGWDTPVTVILTGVDDNVIDGTQATPVTFAIDTTASDPAFRALAPDTITVSTADDDVAGFLARAAGGGALDTLSVDESGTTADFEVILLAEPAGAVVLTLTNGDASEISLSTASVSFDATNWNAPATVTVTGVDDAIIDGTQLTTINVAVDATASDDAFDALPPVDVFTNTTDDDTGGYVVIETGSGTVVTEAGGLDSLSVALTAEPASDVVLDVTSGNSGEVTVNPAQLTFAPGAWDTPQWIVLTGVDELIDDGDALTIVSVQVNAPASDDDFDALPPDSTVVTTVDDDTAGFTVTESAGLTVVGEGGPQDTIMIVLDAEPRSNVILSITAGDALVATPSPTSLTYTPGNWNVAQEVIITGTDDLADDGDQFTLMAISVLAPPLSDSTYVDVPQQTIGVTAIDDDEPAGFFVDDFGGLAVTEGGVTDNFAVVLTTEPESDVILDITSSDPGEVVPSPTSLTFSPTNWSDRQFVTVAPVDDDIIDGQQAATFVIAIDTLASAPSFSGLDSQTVAVTIDDNDAAGLVFADTASTAVTEGGPIDPFTVRLAAEPASNVVLSVVSSDPTQFVSDSATITFTPATWDIPVTVPIRAIDDAFVETPLAGTLTVAVVDGSSDDDFDGLTSAIAVDVFDDDGAGIILADTAGLTVTEGGAGDSFTIALSASPTGSVLIRFSSQDSSEVIPDSASVTFTSANWNQPQVIPLSAVDEPTVDGTQTTAIDIVVDNGASDPEFQGLAETLSVSTVDNDAAGFTLTDTAGIALSEAGDSTAFQLVLTSQPILNVVFTVASSDPGEVVSDSTTITFTPASWNVPRPVPLRGVDDDFEDGDQASTISVTVNPAFSDPAYTGLGATVAVATLDDDTASFTLAGTAAIVLSETGTSDQFTIQLGAQPFSTVELDIVLRAPDEVAVDSTTVTFTSVNWNFPKTLTLTGVDDDIIDGPIASNVVVSVDIPNSDPEFADVLPDSFGVTTTDDDVAGFTVDEFGGVAVNEAGGTDNFSVVLDAEPASDVVIAVVSADTGELTVSDDSLTFTPLNWDSVRTVVVTGVDDAQDLPDGLVDVVLSVDDARSDADFSGLSQTVQVTTFDDDGVGFIINEGDGVFPVEGGQTDGFSVVLTSSPGAGTEVVLSVTSANTAEVTTDTDSLTFTPGDWSVPQQVTVTAVDDAIIDPGTITIVTVGVDPARSDDAYDALPPRLVSVTSVDNDLAALVLADTAALTVVENGATDAFNVSLSAAPASNVTLTITPTDASEVQSDSASLTFTPLNWDTPQPVPLAAVDDAIIDGAVQSFVTVAVAAGSDPGFLGLSEQARVTTNDDDLAGFVLTDTTGIALDEAGTTVALVGVALTAEPASPVVLTITPQDGTEVSSDSSSITLDATNWSVPQDIPLRGVDDLIVDGDVATLVDVAVNAGLSDPAFATVPTQVIPVTTNDDDVAAFVLSDTASFQVSEPGTTSTFQVVLSAAPESPVVFSITPSDVTEALPDSTSLTFTPANWNIAQPVPVTAVDDAEVDGSQASTMTVAVNGAISDPAWTSLGSQVVQVVTTDNDDAGLVFADTTGIVLTEDGPTESFQVRLAAAPDSAVVLNVTSSDVTEVTSDSATVTFDPSDWDTFKFVPLRPVQDSVIDGTQNATISVAVAPGSDVAFIGLTADISVAVDDDDAAGFTLEGTSGINVTESGSTAQFTARLDAEPASPVVLSISSGDLSEVTPDSTSLTFTPSDWFIAQPIPVRGVDDDIIDGDVASTVTVFVFAPGSDPAFGSVPNQFVPVTTLDDDVAGFILSDTLDLTVGEDGSVDQFAVRLTAEPSAPVVLDISSSDSSEVIPDSATVTFDPTNWDQLRQIPVRGIDDPLVDGTTTSVITVAVGTAPAEWSGVPSQGTSVDNVDDDLVGLVLADTAGLTVSEDGTTATFQVSLAAQPTTPVVILLSSSDSSEVIPDSASLTFDDTNWSIPQPVPLAPQDDAEVDGSVAVTIGIDVDPGSDPIYVGISESVAVTSLDDDAAAIVLADTTGLTVSEDGLTTDAFQVRLSTVPTSPVVLRIEWSDSSEVMSDSTTLTMDAGNWNVDQTVPLEGIQDVAVDGTVVSLITVSVDPGSDAEYLGLSETFSVSTTDDDIGILTVADTAGLTVSEPATVDSFSVVLGSQPISPVFVTIGTSDPTEVVSDSSLLSFDETTWSTPVWVPVRAVDDALVDGTLLSTIGVAVAAGSDPAFSTLSASVTVSTLDDDAAGLILVDTAGLAVSEPNTTAVVQVSLSSQPDSAVTIAIVTSDSSEVVPDAESLTFLSATWNAPQNIVLSAVDDDIVDGTIASQVDLTVAAGSDVSFAGVSETLNVSTADDDVADLEVVEIGGTSVGEASGTDDFTVVLTAQPGSNVVVALENADVGEISLDADSLTFTPLNWDSVRTVTVTGVDEAQPDGDQITEIVVVVDPARSDDAFDALADTILATTLDDDGVGITITEIGSTIVDESGTVDDFAVRLTAQPAPSTEVVLALASDDVGEATVAAAAGPADSLVFTFGNWDQDQVVQVTGVDDAIVDGSQVTAITLTIDQARTDAAFDTVSVDTVNATTTDDDAPTYTLSDEIGLSVDESGTTDIFQIVLDEAPVGTVIFDILPTDSSEVAADSSTITFDNTNWNIPQPVQLSGVDDVTVDGTIASQVLVAVNPGSDPLWLAAVQSSVDVVTTDDDVAAFTIADTAGLTVAEPNGTDNFTVVLDAQPVGAVILNIVSSDPTEVVSDSASLTFTSANWNVAQPVPLSAVDDFIVDGTVVATITVSVNPGSDVAWLGVASQNAQVSITDNDVADLLYSDTLNLTVSEDGLTVATFGVSLSAEPVNPVTLTIQSDSSQVVSDSATVVFTAANWNDTVQVPMRGVDDSLVEGDVTTVFTVAVSPGSDTEFLGLSDDISITTTDDDAPGYTLADTAGLTVAEPSGTDVFTVVLDAQPQSPVVFTISSSDSSEVVPDSSSLTFTTANWNVAQPVPLTAQDDFLVDGTVVAQIVVAIDVGSTDPAWISLAQQSANVSVTDDEVADLLFADTTALIVSEDGLTTATFGVSLSAEPVGTVTLTIQSDSTEVISDSSTVVFTAANWNDTVQVPMTGVDDFVVDGDVLSIFTVAVQAGSDGAFLGLTDNISITTTDDDVADLVFADTTGLTVSEDGLTTASFGVSLSAQPVGTVTLTISTDLTEVTSDSSTVVFTAANWNDTVQIPLEGVDDFTLDGDVLSNITVAVQAGSDAAFIGLTDDISITTLDDEVAGIVFADTTGLVVSEDGLTTATFGVSLSAQPQGNVTLTFQSDSTEVVSDSATVVFTPSNWNDTVQVPMTGVDDLILDGDVLTTFDVAVDGSSDPGFLGLTTPVSITTTDDETAALIFSDTTNLSVNEAGTTTVTFGVTLSAEPVGTVRLTIQSDSSEVQSDSADVVFTSANWNTVVQVPMTAQDDSFADGDSLTIFTVAVDDAASDNAWDGLSQDISITTVDDEVAGVTVNEIDGASDVTEGDPTPQTIDVVLDAQPETNVVFTVTDDDLDDSEISLNVTQLTFTPANWNVIQTVEIVGLADGINDGDQVHNVTIAIDAANSANPFDALGPWVFDVTIFDIDPPEEDQQ